MVQLAQTTMRSELGKMSLDETLKERDTLNISIAKSINDASFDWYGSGGSPARSHPACCTC